MNVEEMRRNVITNSPHVAKLSHNPGIFYTDVPAPLKECKIHFSPMQSGSGNPSPSNVRPISGWSQIKYANLANEHIIDTTGSSGEYGNLTLSNNHEYPMHYTINGSYNTLTNMMLLRTKNTTNANVPYYIYGLPFVDYNGTAFSWFAGEGNGVKSVATNSKTIFANNINGSSIVADGTGEMRIYFRTMNGSRSYNLDFYPNISTIAPTAIDWTSLGVVAGGYVDLVNGQLVEEVSKRILPSATNYALAVGTIPSGLGYISYRPAGVFGRTMDITKPIISDRFKQIEWTSTKNITTPWVMMMNNNYFVLIGDSTLTTKEAWDNFYAQNDYVSVCAYPETPSSFTIATNNIKTIRGMNDIWSDANGNIDISYWKH